MGNMRSTPWPKLIFLTVKLACGPRVRAITTPSNACNRSLSPSLIFTCTRTLSPGTKAGRSVRNVLARSFSMIRFDMMMSLRYLYVFAHNLGQQFFIFLAEHDLLKKIGAIPHRLF